MPKDEAYLEAEQKIQQALQSGATKLDLGGMKKPNPDEKRNSLNCQILLGNAKQLTH